MTAETHAGGYVVVPREPTEAMLNAAPASHSQSFKAIWPKICGDIYRAMLSAAPPPQEPKGGASATDDLVDRFAAALKAKLRAAGEKYGFDDAWKKDDWRDKLIEDLWRHVQKGDPRDVAAYCAFAWHHDWSLSQDQIVGPIMFTDQNAEGRYTEGSYVEEGGALREVIARLLLDSQQDLAVIVHSSPDHAEFSAKHLSDRILAALPSLAQAQGERGGAEVPTDDMIRVGAWRAKLHREANPGDTWEDTAREVFTVMSAAAPPATGWRPIETAPKDGTVIDVWRNEGGRDTVFWGMPHHQCGEMGQYCDSDWHGIRAPGWVCNTFNEFIGRNHNPFTHWQPLPAPPALPAQQEGGE